MNTNNVFARYLQELNSAKNNSEINNITNRVYVVLRETKLPIATSSTDNNRLLLHYIRLVSQTFV